MEFLSVKDVKRAMLLAIFVVVAMIYLCCAQGNYKNFIIIFIKAYTQGLLFLSENRCYCRMHVVKLPNFFNIIINNPIIKYLVNQS